jgi:hypothetical protein
MKGKSANPSDSIDSLPDPDYVGAMWHSAGAQLCLGKSGPFCCSSNFSYFLYHGEGV